MSVGRQLGLKRGIVRIVTHDPAWGNAYVRTSTRARSTLEGLPFDMEHVGSTSVPGLDAKPIIDVAIGVPEALIPEAVQRLASAGFEYRGDQREEGGHVLVECQGEADLRIAHLHVVPTGSRQWKDYLRFRNRLRADPGLREQYAALKRELAAAHPEDRVAYTAAKTQFVNGCLRPDDIGA